MNFLKSLFRTWAAELKRIHAEFKRSIELENQFIAAYKTHILPELTAPTPLQEQSFAMFTILKELYDRSILDEEINIMIKEVLDAAQAEQIDLFNLRMRDSAKELFEAVTAWDVLMGRGDADKILQLGRGQYERAVEKTAYALQKVHGVK